MAWQIPQGLAPLVPWCRAIKDREEVASQQCPSWKVIEGTSLAVDAFNFGAVPGVDHYILSHFHSDHYVGLSSKWSRRIVCSSITMRLAISKFGLAEDLFLLMEPGEERMLGEVMVTTLDANHCPGSLMFLLKLGSGQIFLHTGDFRACPEMESVLSNLSVDRLYLDTTYCRQEYDLPSQADVISWAVELVEEFVTQRPGTAVLCGAYTVGKERMFKALAKGLDCRLWTEKERRKVWGCLDDKELMGRMVGERSCPPSQELGVQVVDIRLVSWKGLAKVLEVLEKVGRSNVLGVRPTGWSLQDKESSLAGLKIITKGQLSLLEVPYSEHSSYSELERFVKFLGIREVGQIVPTANRRQCRAMEETFQQWIEKPSGHLH